MKKCTNCNKVFDDDKMFCPQCGCPLTSATASATGEAAGRSGSDENMNTPEQVVMSAQDSPREGRKPTARGLIVAGLAVAGIILLGTVPLSGIALLLIFGGIFLVWRMKCRK